ncbi:MAG: hypothetical protein IJR92_00755 [Alphaproteobacteria bacterium]|nr:hypothetical protein [Alphaproteobacteria bacterium]
MQKWVVTSSLAIVLVASGTVATPAECWYTQTATQYCFVEKNINLTYGGIKFLFDTDHRFAVMHTDFGYHIVDKDLAIDLYADSLSELQHDLDYLLEDNFINYVLAPDDELAGDGLRLKNNMKNLIKCA